MKLALPRAYLGTMTFAWSSQTSSVVDESVALEMVKRFVDCNEELGIETHLIDTARVYAGGKTEPMVGHVLRNLTPTSGRIVVGTKAHPSVDSGLSNEGIRLQLQMSLDEMKLSSVGEYYLHQPDTENSLLESLQCAHDLVTEGMIQQIGMSNYHASEVARAFELCQEHNLTPPKVYQGLYNPLNRLVEEELLPILRENNCSFVAYNPLAAGLLSGKHMGPNAFVQGRFQNNQNYIPRFYNDANFQAVELIRKQCDKDGISMVEATYRWLLCHSDLDEKDGLLIGASSLDQLDQNLRAYAAAASEESGLSEELLQVFDHCWEITKPDAFPYWRGYSSDMPNREALDPGASYNAAKAK
jgi:aflatoxin B1 aldehyde reductase